MAAEATTVAAKPNQRPRPVANDFPLTDSTLLWCSTWCGKFLSATRKRARSVVHQGFRVIADLPPGGPRCGSFETAPPNKGVRNEAFAYVSQHRRCGHPGRLQLV